MVTRIRRKPFDFLKRWLLVTVMSRMSVFGFLLALGRLFRALLPGAIKRIIPNSNPHQTAPNHSGGQGKIGASGQPVTMLVLEGCVQSELSPEVNRWLTRLLATKNIELEVIPAGQCCGAMEYHSGFPDRGRNRMKQLIDQCWPVVESGVKQIIVTASGCGAFLIDYEKLLENDPVYADRAARISALCCDASQVIADTFGVDNISNSNESAELRVAWHSPCTLQNALKVRGVVEKLMISAGFELVITSDGTTCCGSAGSYSLLEPGRSLHNFRRERSMH